MFTRNVHGAVRTCCGRLRSLWQVFDWDIPWDILSQDRAGGRAGPPRAQPAWPASPAVAGTPQSSWPGSHTCFLSWLLQIKEFLESWTKKKKVLLVGKDLKNPEKQTLPQVIFKIIMYLINSKPVRRMAASLSRQQLRETQVPPGALVPSGEAGDAARSSVIESGPRARARNQEAGTTWRKDELTLFASLNPKLNGNPHWRASGARWSGDRASWARGGPGGSRGRGAPEQRGLPPAARERPPRPWSLTRLL